MGSRRGQRARPQIHTLIVHRLHTQTRKGTLCVQRHRHRHTEPDTPTHRTAHTSIKTHPGQRDSSHTDMIAQRHYTHVTHADAPSHTQGHTVPHTQHTSHTDAHTGQGLCREQSISFTGSVGCTVLLCDGVKRACHGWGQEEEEHKAHQGSPAWAIRQGWWHHAACPGRLTWPLGCELQAGASAGAGLVPCEGQREDPSARSWSAQVLYSSCSLCSRRSTGGRGTAAKVARRHGSGWPPAPQVGVRAHRDG